MAQLKQIPSLSSAKIEVLDYSEKLAKDLLKDSGVKVLPAVLLSDNNIPELA
jgi:hypothetical protein